MRPVGPASTRAGDPGPGPESGGRAHVPDPPRPPRHGRHRDGAAHPFPPRAPRDAAGHDPDGDAPTEFLAPARERARWNAISEQRTEYLPVVGLRGPGESLPSPPVPPPGPGSGDEAAGDSDRNGGIGDGIALTLCSAFGSVAGLLGMLIATRIMPQEEVGRASEFVSAFQLIGGIAQLNLGLGLMRWLPGAGRRSVRLVFGSLLLIMPLSGLLGLIYGSVVPRIAEAAGGGSFGLGLVVLVLTCAGWGVFVVHDFVMVAIGRPWVAVWRNATFAVVRIVLLVALGTWLASEALVLSWAIPVVLWIAAGTVALWFMVRRYARSGGPGRVPPRAEMVAFLADRKSVV